WTGGGPAGLGHRPGPHITLIRCPVLSATLALLRSNRDYRRLWAAQIVSLTGDWFTLIALAVLVSRDSGGSGLAVSGLALAQMAPWVLVGPWSGGLADRFHPKRLLP